MNKHTLTIATYNILYCSNPEVIQANLTMLIERGVQIFCLQEVTAATYAFLHRHLCALPHSTWHMKVYIPKGQYFGTAVLWNSRSLQAKSIRSISLPHANDFTLFERILTLLSGTQPKIITRTMVSILFNYKSKHIRISSLHLDHIGGEKNRTQQLRSAYDHLKTTSSSLIDVLCGDFNTYNLLQNGHEYRQNKETLKGFVDATEHIGWSHDIYDIATYGKKSLFSLILRLLHIHWHKQLDFIWVRSGYALRAQREDLPGSDHRPILADISW